MIYNALGIYAINVKLDYAQAIDYFMRGMELAQEHGDGKRYVVFCSNLAVAHFLRYDPDGLRYACKAHDYGIAHGDRYALLSGSFTKALMYYLQGGYHTAESCLQETLSLVDSFYDRTGVYHFQANVMLA